MKKSGNQTIIERERFERARNMSVKSRKPVPGVCREYIFIEGVKNYESERENRKDGA